MDNNPPQEARRRLQTMHTIMLLACLVSSALLPIVAMSTRNRLEVLTTALFALLSWITLFLLRSRYAQFVAHLYIFAVLGIGTYGVVASGSVRSSVVFLFIGGVAAAGTFLGRAALIAATTYSVAALGGLAWAEAQGLFQKTSFSVGVNVWATQATCTVVVGIMVYFNRMRSENAHQRELQELGHRQGIERERDRAQERFSRIFRATPVPMIAQSASNGEIVDVNPAFEACYGHTREAVLGRVDDFLWGKPEQREAYLHTLRTQARAHLSGAIGLRANGQRFEGHVSSELGLDAEDQLVITTVFDATEQNKALSRLRRSEERFSKAFHFSPLHLVITRLKDDVVIEMSRANGTPGTPDTSEGVGRPAAELGPWFRPEDREGVVERLTTLGHLHGHATVLLRPDGTTLNAKIWAEQIDFDDVPCMLSCIVDVDEEKRREAQLLDLAHGMASHTGHAFFAELVQAMAKTMGADLVAVGELDNGGMVNTLAVWAGGGPAPNVTYRLEGTPCQMASGQQGLCVYPDHVDVLFPDDLTLAGGRFKAYVGQSLHDDAGQTIGVLVALWHQPLANHVESTALLSICAGRANAELLRLQRDREVQNFNETLEQRVRSRTVELQKLNAELDSFAYSISHDLKTPLRAIDGFTQLLSERLDKRLDDEERQLMKRVLSATHRMATLMADLLALTHVSQQTLQHERLNLSMMAQEELEGCLKTQPRSKLHTHIELGLVTHADARLTRIVLKNLICNALKFTRDQKAPSIEIGRAPTAPDADPGAPVFFVRDNGAGFDMAHAAKLFKPFQRLHMPSAGFEGTGMGLATVHRIVERHGGTISGTAAPDAGAEFRFTLKPSIPANTSTT